MNHCVNCNMVQGYHYLHDDPNTAIYKHLFYEDETPCIYHEIVSDYILPIKAVIPTYADEDGPKDALNSLMQHYFDPDDKNIAGKEVT